MTSHNPARISAPAGASFQWDDPFLLEDRLTGDARMIRDAARDLHGGNGTWIGYHAKRHAPIPGRAQSGFQAFF